MDAVETLSLPDTDWVERALGTAVLVERRPNVYVSTFPSEVLVCDGLTLLAKYGTTDYESAHGHRGGVAYEATVYERVLESSAATTPRFHGSYEEDGLTALFVEYLEGCTRLKHTDPPALDLAARWLGAFHREHEAASDGTLIRHDHAYHLVRAERARELEETPSWFGRVCDAYERLLPEILALPITVVHGEYTVKNVLVRDGRVYPVDWQSAGIGIGEADLVELVEGWGEEIARTCEREYATARWGFAPARFAGTLLLARVYHELRWLGDVDEWRDRGAPPQGRFDALERAARQLEILP